MRLFIIAILVANNVFAQYKERGALIGNLNISTMQGMTVVKKDGSICLFASIGGDLRKFKNVKLDTTDLKSYDRHRRKFKQFGVSYMPAVLEQTKFTSFLKFDLTKGTVGPLATHTWGISIAKGLADRGFGSWVGGFQYSIATQKMPVTLLYLRGRGYEGSGYNFFLMGLKIPLYDKVLRTREQFSSN